jgi:DUF2075 family protein
MNRSLYSDTIESFLLKSDDELLGVLIKSYSFQVDVSQKNAWIEQFKILKRTLSSSNGKIYLEYAIPRMGKFIDALLLIDHVIFILEFKVGESSFNKNSIEQVWDYALDLSNFHDTSQNRIVVPILIATDSKISSLEIISTKQNKSIIQPIYTNGKDLEKIINSAISSTSGEFINPEHWENGKYSPTPTIIEAAKSLYFNHSVENISRTDSDAKNISMTSNFISSIVLDSKNNNKKSICFVTGVPGAGKTLVGLDIATRYIDNSKNMHGVYLSGNGTLVDVLREALIRDKYLRDKEIGNPQTKGKISGEVKSFIQNVHNFRDEYLNDSINPPFDHITIFDEAQRAWNLEQTSKFMKDKRSKPDFNRSEPEFLISCMDRHKDWAVVVCLVGGGQEINTGESGIGEWLISIDRSFPDWDVYLSKELFTIDSNVIQIIENLENKNKRKLNIHNELHLSTSLRSFRTENYSLFINEMLNFKKEDAKKLYKEFKEKFPIVITRDLNKAKKWIKNKASGSERYGLVASSKAERLKPHAIFISNEHPIQPIPWFLNGKEDVRSSYYLEDAATEFKIQGLELDWICMTWDADFRYTKSGWDHWEFKGHKWNRIHKEIRKLYQKNAYRVLLTRARQGMIIVVPEGDKEDHTRLPEFYNPIYEYLQSIGLEEA